MDCPKQEGGPVKGNVSPPEVETLLGRIKGGKTFSGVSSSFSLASSRSFCSIFFCCCSFSLLGLELLQPPPPRNVVLRFRVRNICLEKSIYLFIAVFFNLSSLISPSSPARYLSHSLSLVSSKVSSSPILVSLLFFFHPVDSFHFSLNPPLSLFHLISLDPVE